MAALLPLQDASKAKVAARRNEILKNKAKLKDSEMMEQYHNQRIKLRSELDLKI